MSDASVIRDVSETLRSILDEHLNPPLPDTGVGAPVTVTVDNPQRSAGEDLRVNLYLYHILQDESRRNIGPRLELESLRTGSSATFVDEPLPLKLFYMVTAFAPDGRTEHRLIGETVQALYQHRIIAPALLKGNLGTSPVKADKIQLVMLNQDLETLHRIWGNFQEALRPSATYEVEGVYLDASRANAPSSVQLVQQRAIGVVPIPFLSDVSPPTARPGDTVRLRGANLDLRSPDDTTSLVRILANGIPITPLPARLTNRALSFVVPADAPPGPLVLQAQIGDFASGTVILEVLPR